MEEFLKAIFSIITEPYILFGLICLLICWSLDGVHIVLNDTKDKEDIN